MQDLCFVVRRPKIRDQMHKRVPPYAEERNVNSAKGIEECGLSFPCRYDLARAA